MKNLLLIAIFFSIIARMSAQDVKAGGHLGVLSSALQQGSRSLGTAWGVGAGVHSQVYLADRWSVIGKLGFQSKVFNYIEVPVMAQWHFGRNARWYLQLGPYVGYALNPTSGYKNLDFGVAYGLGYEFEVGYDSFIFIESAPTIGLSNIRNSSTKVNNTSSQFSIGYRYTLDF